MKFMKVSIRNPHLFGKKSLEITKKFRFLELNWSIRLVLGQDNSVSVFVYLLSPRIVTGEITIKIGKLEKTDRICDTSMFESDYIPLIAMRNMFEYSEEFVWDVFFHSKLSSIRERKIPKEMPENILNCDFLEGCRIVNSFF